MKSVIAQGSTVAKAIEEALKKADMPQEFFVKLLENAQPGFLGFGAKKAKIALFFKENVAHQKHQETMFEKGTYENLFNNQSISKQVEQQLKELDVETKSFAQPKKQNSQQPRVHQQQHDVAKMHTRPLNNQPKSHEKSAQPQNATAQQRPLSSDSGAERSDENRPRRRRSRYFRPRRQNNDNGGNSSNSSNNNGSQSE
jgi:hypothetical protein